MSKALLEAEKDKGLEGQVEMILLMQTLVGVMMSQ